MGKAIGISHAKHFLAINRRNEIAIGKRLAGFAIGNCENLGESFGELERDRSLKGGSRVAVADEDDTRTSYDGIAVCATTANGRRVQAIYNDRR